MTKRGTIRETGTLGDKVLPKITHAVRDVMIATKKAMLPWEHHIRVKATQDIIDRIGHEIADHYGPIAQKILDNDPGTLSPETRQFLEDSISGEHQLKAVTGLLMGSAQSAIGLILSNELAPAIYPIVSANPNLDIDVQSAANSAAQGQTSYANAQQIAADQGINAGNFASLVDLARQYPSIADALDMYRRKDISETELMLCIERNATPVQFREAYKALANNVLSLADAALAYLRSDITLADAQKIAHENGYTDEQLTVFIGNTGEPLGLEQLLEGLRRDFISEATVERGIKQSRIRNEWIPLALKLRFSPMSVADAVNAVVQNHLSMAEAAKIAQQNGLEASAFPVLIETAGEPLSRTEMEQLYNRGKVTRADVEQALRESRLKNKYVTDAFDLHVRLLEPRILSSAVEFGAVSHADAVKRALEYGFSQADAEILVNAGSARKLHTRNNQTVAAAETLYVDNIITVDELRQVAKVAGFGNTEIDVIVKTSEYRRQAKWITTVLSVIRSKYVAHHIDEATATHYIDSLGLNAGNRAELIAIWTMERAANTAQLTVAEIIKAMKKNTIQPDEALSRLIAKGYSEADAVILLEDA
jgi:hypothetical protein